MTASGTAKPPQQTEVEDSGAMPLQTSSTVKIWVLLAVGHIWLSLNSCLCGYSTFSSIVVVIPVVLFLGTWQFLFRRRTGWAEQYLGAAGYGLILALVIKNAGDILYFGHEAMFR